LTRQLAGSFADYIGTSFRIYSWFFTGNDFLVLFGPSKKYKYKNLDLLVLFHQGKSTNKKILYGH
jgi:hypothetical protein